MDRQYLSVYALNAYLKARFEQDVNLTTVYLKGEISNYRPHPSGHLYFTIKDEKSKISAIMFSSDTKSLDFQLENGMQVLIKGRVSVYEANGKYQVYVKKIEQDGLGELYIRFEKLKEQLLKEGLFDSSHKKNIPTYPKTIAILSAKQGAGLQDVLKTIKVRFPCVTKVVFPIPVQGKTAYMHIIQTLKYVDTLGFDTIILARGGGSIEELWNFNEEALARCIYELKTPIITGIGHETDVTICDYVSDFHALTPTFAAMKATPNQKELKEKLDYLNKQIYLSIDYRLTLNREKLGRIKNRYALNNPELVCSQECLKLMNLQDKLNHQFDKFYYSFSSQLQQYISRLNIQIDKRIESEINQFQLLTLKLDSLSPLKVMTRGYSLVYKQNKIVKSVDNLHSGEHITIHLKDGKKEAIVK